MNAGYLVSRGSSFLQRHAYNESYRFTAGMASIEHATVFTRTAALAMARHFTAQGDEAEVIPDLVRPSREPQIGIDAVRAFLVKAA